jgi:hypothetical protein
MTNIPLDLPSIAAHDAQPLTAQNQPYQRSITYRADDYSSLRYHLLLHLQDAFPRWNALLAQNRGEQDFGVTFIELFSYLADILGFYQNCRANEAFLRTAVLPGSLIELCKLIDYRIGPGASATALEAFFCKDGASGTVPAGFKIKTTPQNGQPALVFETSAELAVSSTLNVLHLRGYNRSELFLSATGATPESSVLLDQGYAGLTSGSFVVITSPSKDPIPIQLLAVTDEGAQRRISWKPGALPANLDLPVADVVILGKPKQRMQLSGRAEAGQIAAGDSSAAVDDASFFVPNLLPAPAVFVAPGFKQATLIVSTTGAVVSWAPAFNLALQRSETSVYAAGWTNVWDFTFGSIAPGDKSIFFVWGSIPANDFVVLWGFDNTVELARIATVSGSSYGLADPVIHGFPFGAWILPVAIADPELNKPGQFFTRLSPVRLAANTNQLILDRGYDGLLPGQTVVITDGEVTLVNTLTGVTIDSQQRTVLTLAAPISGLKVATTDIYGPFDLQMRVDGYNRATGSLAAGVAQITLDGAITGMAAGRYLILEDSNGAEALRIVTVTVNNGNTQVDLEAVTSRAYPLADTSVFGNVAEISQGESVTEDPLGSGDQSQANQVFQLHKEPTTYIHDPHGPRGASNTLQVFVGDEQWTEVESLAESGPNDHHIMTEIDENQAMSFMGGDGHYGAAFPTGQNNISARYRTGIGTAGNVAANAISVMAAPLPFMLSSRNPIAAAGGADPDNLESTRQLAPLTVRTLDRAVSIQDFQDLALTYSGIAKARATFARVDGRATIVLVVATNGGQPLPDSLRKTLAAFIADRSVPSQHVLIRDYKPVPIRLSVEVHVRDNFLRAPTGVLVQQFLGAATTPDGSKGYFNFDQRGLGENLYLSDVYALVERVEGVQFLVITEFRAEANGGASGMAQDVIAIPADAVATGGDPLDPRVGILSVKLIGGIA